MSSIKEVIRSLAQAKGLNLPKLELELGFGNGTISKWDNSSPSADKLQIVADYFSVTTDFLLGREIDVTKIPGYVSMPVENKKIPIIGSVKCGPDGLAFEYIEGYVFIDENITGEVIAFRCKGDSMKDMGIADGDIAIVRKQCDVENGELAVVIINGDEGTLKRIRHHDGILALEAANQEYSPRIFAGEEINIVKIIGKVLEVRKKF